jgi:cyclic pyranopterin phosphate synthase
VSGFSHVDEEGAARMVDVSGKDITARTATAVGRVELSAECLSQLAALPKGDVIATARLAGIMAAKRTPDLVPLCHPIALHEVSVDLVPDATGIAIQAVARTADRTGVEMEALTAVAVAALTVIDMTKAVDPRGTITAVRVVEKTGGKTGPWRA